MEITGAILVGNENRVSETTFGPIDPSTGGALGLRFHEARESDVADACRLADEAFPVFSELVPDQRARFLETVAERIEALGDALIARAMAETGLPRARLEGERARTIGQLKLFAAVVREGAWMDVTIDHALPERMPLPRPDLRRRNLAIGPVAVFGASNFPLAFSVAGGDTAAAFAAGCPVVIKGHPAHPGTGEYVALAVREAVRQCGLPAGVFSYLPGVTQKVGGALVADPHIKAVAFTGSRAGGIALMKIAAAASAFTADPELAREVFGASSIIVRARDLDDVARVVNDLEGQLTATLLFDESEEERVAPLIPLLARKAGRILANGWPTGVEVCHAMVHGGPFPATSEGRTTSVGALAIDRFLRPVCYQNLPDRLLPPTLRETNPYKVTRRIDGVVKAVLRE